MKKLFSVLIVAVLLVSCMVTAAFADTVATITVGKDTVKAGETATISFNVSELTYQDYWVTIKYDAPLVLKAVNEGSATHGGFGATLSSGKVATYAHEQQTKSGTLFTATFEVPEGTKPGKYPVKLEVVAIYNDNDEKLEVGTVAGYVEVECTHKWGEWVTTTEPECGKAGVQTATCEICNETKTQSLTALDHKWGAWVTTTEPKCEVKGEQTRVCLLCDAKETRELDALEHKWGTWIVTTPATCTAEGEETSTCELCGETKTQVVAKIDHTAKTENGKPVYYGKDHADHHWFVCSVCETEFGHQDHFKYDKEDGYHICICGHNMGKVDSGLDDEPANGDPTLEIALGCVAMITIIAAGAVLVLKRRAVK